MAFKYEEVVPWGRNYDEYVRMFNLSPDDLKKRILGCGDGPASFNLHCNRQGGQVVSVDPIYHMTREQIEQRIQETYDTVLSQTRKNQELFNWDRIGSVDELGEIRMAAMRDFLGSFEEGLIQGNYIAGSVLELPFNNNQFEISLSSHFLLLYTENLSLQFHLDAIKEMLRVSEEVRIFPLLDVNGSKSVYLEEILKVFQDQRIEIRKVDYEFQKGGDELLIIWKQ